MIASKNVNFDVDVHVSDVCLERIRTRRFFSLEIISHRLDEMVISSHR